MSSHLAANALDLLLQGDLVSSSNSITEVDRQVATINLALEKLSNKASCHIVRLLRKRNTLVPIHQLPIELMVKVFIQALGMEDEGGDWSGQAHFSKLHSLAQVAWEWGWIVKNFPEFWTRIDTGVDRHLLGAALTRSKDLPLTVFARGVGTHYNNANWETVSRQISRWSAVEIYSDGSDDLEDALKYGLGEHGVARNLMRLKVRSKDTIFVSTTFGTNLPKLRHLDLGGIFFSAWSSKFLHQLEWLSLENISGGHFAIEEMLDLLRGCDQLKLFRLWNVQFNDNTILTPAASIGLDTVIDFALEGLPPTDTLHVLNSLRLPHCTQYTVCPEGTWDDTAMLVALINCATRTLTTALEKADYVSLEVRDDGSCCRRTNQKQEVHFQVRPLAAVNHLV